MKKLFFFVMTAVIAIACSEPRTLVVSVSNDLPIARTNEMIEVSMDSIVNVLSMKDSDVVVVYDAEGKDVPYQVTYDNQLIFPVNVPANGTRDYSIGIGQPAIVPVVACGRKYPERKDDIAWENDLVAYRTYGPALQASGEKAYGYDVWTKYHTTEPVVEERYEKELNPETVAKIDSVRKINPALADSLYAQTSYHYDHGNGLDCYKVGPTLGAGTAALIADGKIVYPYCYKDFEILDNGPLRFTVQLKYNPLTVKADTNVVESRIISLDAGSYMNKATISFAGLSAPTELAPGIVLHEPEGTAAVTLNATNGYMTYVDPTDNPKGNNGKIFVGVVTPNTVKEAKAVYFSKEEATERGADGEALLVSNYQPDAEYTYYFGSAWSKAAIQDREAWNEYVSEFAQKAKNPLKVVLK